MKEYQVLGRVPTVEEVSVPGEDRQKGKKGRQSERDEGGKRGRER